MRREETRGHTQAHAAAFPFFARPVFVTFPFLSGVGQKTLKAGAGMELIALNNVINVCKIV